MNLYELKYTEDIISPSLIYYIDIIQKNIEKAIEKAGSPDRLWPHVKSHKSLDLVKLQMRYGITKFKTATVAEAEMAAEAGAEKIILAYPLVGPNINRYINLTKAYPDSHFYAIGDDEKQLEQLSKACECNQVKMDTLIDVNMGMNRTGIAIDKLIPLCRYVCKLPGLHFSGFHCYDGNHNNKDFTVRNQEVMETDEKVGEVIKELNDTGIDVPIVVAGGTPSFPCHQQDTDWFLSPGTAIITDAGYYMNLPDLNFIPGAALLTRVISHPAPGIFTLDLGYKGIASDPTIQRGYIVGLENAVPIVHSEEHWAFQIEDHTKIPPIGTCLYVVPTHICPTTALYPEILVAKDGEIVEKWEVTARNRKINY